MSWFASADNRHNRSGHHVDGIIGIEREIRVLSGFDGAYPVGNSQHFRRVDGNAAQRFFLVQSAAYCKRSGQRKVLYRGFRVIGAQRKSHSLLREHRRGGYVVVRKLRLAAVAEYRSEYHSRHVLGLSHGTTCGAQCFRG